MDDVNRSSVIVNLSDVAGKTITDQVEMTFYNQRSQSLNGVEAEGPRQQAADPATPVALVVGDAAVVLLPGLVGSGVAHVARARRTAADAFSRGVASTTVASRAARPSRRLAAPSWPSAVSAVCQATTVSSSVASRSVVRPSRSSAAVPAPARAS